MILLKRYLVSALFVLSLFQMGVVVAQDYVLDPDWPKPLPEGIEWGQVPNVTIDADGFIYAFHRADPPVLKFDPEGKKLFNLDRFHYQFKFFQILFVCLFNPIFIN